MYKVKYQNLSLTVLKKSDRLKHGNYKYLIQSSCTAHSAFHTKKGVKRWLSERGLRIGKKLGWNYPVYNLIGSYAKNSMMIDPVLFYSLFYGKTPIPVLDNGDYTEGFISDDDGIRIINLLNPNCKRKIIDRKLIDK